MAPKEASASASEAAAEAAPKATKGSSAEAIVIMPLLLVATRSAERVPEEVIFVVPEPCEWISSSEEVSEDVLCMTERKAPATTKASRELRTASRIAAC